MADKELTKAEIEQQDLVDNAIFALIEELNPAHGTEIEWDIEWISKVRDVLVELYCDKLKLCTEKEFYPYISEESDMVVINGGDDVSFPCAAYNTPRTLDWCEANCPKYYSCDTVAMAQDKLARREGKEE